MGSFGDKLYDNDSALDVLGDLADELDLEASPAHLVTGVGLLAWLHPSVVSVSGARLRAAMDSRPEWVRGAEEGVRATLRAVYRDPEAFVRDRRARSPDLCAVLGSYEDGPREDVLVRAPAGAAVLEEHAERCRMRLDALARSPDGLYVAAGELAAIGPLLELRTLGVVHSPARAASWRRTFERIDRATSDERGYWDTYAAHVGRALDLLGG